MRSTYARKPTCHERVPCKPPSTVMVWQQYTHAYTQQRNAKAQSIISVGSRWEQVTAQVGQATATQLLCARHWVRASGTLHEHTNAGRKSNKGRGARPASKRAGSCKSSTPANAEADGSTNQQRLLKRKQQRLGRGRRVVGEERSEPGSRHTWWEEDMDA